ncbi:hypothetical protein GLUCOINTEAF2_0203890 [Komagataeibacter intermedius AF2]|uniref:Uncharacterized protein n=1 Tax=Komagataeibacter intermedius AF2 TaxID=1458464 RepID=A0A0C1VH05_9PROT|nr:hypothetical protein GLUCOINTEAF2_0204078 [Komagataeibacter intermedius AF2]KPH88238.1 hypothetical protein GLUCOINTEAF2_0203890 [Komagataeibacter intermedius AF2]
MGMRSGQLDASIHKPSIEFLVVTELQTRGEHASTRIFHLAFNLAFLPSCRRRAGLWFNQIMGAHL